MSEGVRTTRPYTALEVTRIRKMREDGVAFAEIARRLGRSEDSVSRRAVASGIAGPRARRMTTEQIASAIEMRKEGVSLRAIGKRFDLSADAVSKLPGMPPTRSRPRQNGSVLGVELPIEQHRMLHEISKSSGMTKATIIRRALAREIERMKGEA